MRKAGLKTLIAEYGGIGFLTYMAVALVVVLVVSAAFLLGFTPDGLRESAGALLVIYVCLKLTQPIRIGVTITLTPIVARYWRRAFGRDVGTKA